MGLFSGATPRTVEARSDGFQLPYGLTSLTPSVSYSGIDAGGMAALRSIAVGSSIDLICSVASELPIDIYRGEGTAREKLAFPGWLEDPGGDGQGIEDWLYQMLQSWLYRGNAYGQVTVRDAAGRPRGISWFHPDDVRPFVDDGRVAWMVKGRRFEPVEDFVHYRVNPMTGQLLGLSQVEMHAVQIGTSLSAASFGRQWFEDGAHPSGMLVNSEASIDQQQAETVKARWLNLFRGTREPAVMGKGWDWKPVSVSAEESQFLETQRFSEAQCARIFGPAMAETLGYETGGSLTYNTVQERRSDLLTLTFNRWLRRTDRILSRLLPKPQYARLNRDAFMESTTLARFEAHSRALADRWRTVNEIREIEDLPPVDWGDVPNEKTTPTVGGN